MGKITSHRRAQPSPSQGNGASPWQVDAAQLLEEHHLVAWSPSQKDRDFFGIQLAAYLASLGDTQVCQFHGGYISDLYSFCNQFERAICNDRVKRVIEGKGGVVDGLRTSLDIGRPLKQRYFIWHDAHIMLKYDCKAFGRLVDALTGVAAESEYVSEDLLVIQRVIFIGAPSLDVYAEDPRGQFRSWYSETGEEPFWRCITGLDRPPVLRYKIEPGLDLAHLPATPVSRPIRAVDAASPRKRRRM